MGPGPPPWGLPRARPLPPWAQEWGPPRGSQRVGGYERGRRPPSCPAWGPGGSGGGGLGAQLEGVWTRPGTAWDGWWVPSRQSLSLSHEAETQRRLEQCPGPQQGLALPAGRAERLGTRRVSRRQRGQPRELPQCPFLRGAGSPGPEAAPPSSAGRASGSHSLSVWTAPPRLHSPGWQVDPSDGAEGGLGPPRPPSGTLRMLNPQNTGRGRHRPCTEGAPTGPGTAGRQLQACGAELLSRAPTVAPWTPQPRAAETLCAPGSGAGPHAGTAAPHTCVHTCTDGPTHVHTCAGVGAYKCAHTCTDGPTCVHLCRRRRIQMCTHPHNSGTQAHTCTPTDTSAHAHLYTDTNRHGQTPV